MDFLILACSWLVLQWFYSFVTPGHCSWAKLLCLSANIPARWANQFFGCPFESSDAAQPQKKTKTMTSTPHKINSSRFHFFLGPAQSWDVSFFGFVIHFFFLAFAVALSWPVCVCVCVEGAAAWTVATSELRVFCVCVCVCCLPCRRFVAKPPRIPGSLHIAHCSFISMSWANNMLLLLVACHKCAIGMSKELCIDFWFLPKSGSFFSCVF